MSCARHSSDHRSRFDEIAPVYDQTRGGEARGDEYASDIDGLLAADTGTVLEIGVGTGVVALGLRRRGRTVVGVDLSRPMLGVAVGRLGQSVVAGDAQCLPVRAGAVDAAVAVWVVHDVADPALLLAEAARVLAPGGRMIVSDTQTHDREDPIGRILAEMTDRLERHRPSRGLAADRVVAMAAPYGFRGRVVPCRREWMSHPAYELAAIRDRAWSAMRDLDEAAYEEVASPALAALEALPQEETVQRAYSEFAVLTLG